MDLVWAFESIAEKATFISELPFRHRRSFTRAVLIDDNEWFGENVLRDAEPHERSLYRRSSSGRPSDQSLPTTRSRWEAAKRPPPARRKGVEQPSPLKKNAAKKQDDDPQRYLLAAKKLLEI
jgi:hypothetical protein